MSGIEYRKIINELSDRGFEIFIDKTFKLYGFHVLEKNDVRKVDVIERLTVMTIKNQKQTLDKYAALINKYLQNYVGCEKGSRAEKYYNRARATADAISKGKHRDHDVEDLVKTFLSLMRQQFAAKGKEISDISVSTIMEDLETIKLLHIKKLKPVKKLQLNSVSGITHNEKVLFCINNYLFLVKNMDEEGVLLQL